jgi:signal transduction histidine kinase
MALRDLAGVPTTWRWWRASSRYRWQDVAVAAVTLVALLLPLLDIGEASCACPDRPAWAYVAVVAGSVPLLWRRTHPFAVMLVAGAAAVAYGVADLPDPPVPYGALIAMHAVAAYGTLRQAIASALIIAVAVPVAISLASGHSDALDYANALLVFSVAWLLGHATRLHRASVEQLRRQAEQVERERRTEAARVAAEAGRRAAEERTRVAREMHDVLTHSVTLMVIQAESGPIAAERGPEAARDVFDAIAENGRRALNDLRHLVALLRSTDQAPSLSPQPTLHDIADLARDTGAAGLPTTVELPDEAAVVPAAVGHAAYRIVQEALTNTARHAGAEHVSIRLWLTRTTLAIEIIDDGGAAPTPGRTAGAGLAGMTERAHALGGVVRTGPHQGRGWMVHADLPLNPRPGAPAASPTT